MRISITSLVLSLLAASAAAAPEKTPAEVSTAILLDIAGLCEQKGMLACEPHIKGFDAVYARLHAFEAMKQTEAEFVAFVRKRYAMPDFSMDKLAATLNLTMDMTITRGSVTDLAKATRVPGGFDVETKQGHELLIRKLDGIWTVRLPELTPEQLAGLEPTRVAAAFKRNVMLYRMLEAEIADLDLDTFARRVVLDFEPVVVAISTGKKREELAKQVPDWEPRLTQVLTFYKRFKNTDDMRAAILAEHPPAKVR